MSAFPDFSGENKSQCQVELDESTRLAQLNHIAELGGRIGMIPSWFGQKPSEPQAYVKDSFDRPGLPIQNLQPGSYGNPGLSLTSEESYALAQAFRPSHLPIEGDGYEHVPSASSKNSWCGSGNLEAGSENTGEDLQRIMDLDVTGRFEDVSDEASHSQRMSSTPSKTSGLSSHTSAGPSDIKLEIDEAVALEAPRTELTPASSLSSQLSPAKSTTPAGLQPPVNTGTGKRRRGFAKRSKLQFADLRPRTSIPSDLPHEELARQSVHAAYSSRLNPFVLHTDEYQLLRSHICHLHVSAYLNIRNRILRLWVRNPLVSVTAEEAAGCALSSRWLGLAEVAYEWLVRTGYINFGCVEVPDTSDVPVKRYKLKRTRRKTIVVVGAGMAGLGCARQLEGLFSHYRERWTSLGEEPPRVVVLEGRARIGGRIYSHPLRNQNTIGLPNQSRCTAEMGAHIITGFNHGNPLSMIIRGQLALHYYPLKDNSTLYDVDGQVVERERDKMVEKLFNDILDRASIYRHKASAVPTAEGDRELIEAGRDPHGEADGVLSQIEAEDSTATSNQPNAKGSDVEYVPGGVDKLTGKAHMMTGPRTKAPPALAAEAMGWRLASSVLAYQDLNLDKVAKSSRHPTLGATMDEAVKQYQFLLDLSPQDMRLLNWHYANLEYANAVNVGKLSLGGWDQDIGNEFEGEHAQVIGGYQQVPRGIWQHPSRLDLRTHKAVKKIHYSAHRDTEGVAKILCEDGEIIEANHIVLTAPLGVLKDKSIAFEPELPSWKRGSIERLGFGTLNKVILAFEEPFWDVDQDMIGLLREAEIEDSLDQDDYTYNRGRFYLFWNCIKTSGRPLLIALMAGDAAHQAESLSDHEIVSEVTQQLAKMFKQTPVPEPSETIVTRWGTDRFACGSYSYVGALSQPGDYDAMAKRVGNLHFAGEATCGTHPATVHGAYISGLRAASEVIDVLLGPISIPEPLVPVPIKVENIPTNSEQDATNPGPAPSEALAHKQARLESFETEILKTIFARLGPRPGKPGKSGANPFLLFSKDKWGECKHKCDEARRAAVGNPNTKASRNEVRAALGQMWREASDDVKRPYVEKTINNRQVNHESAATFHDRLAEWDSEAMSVRREYVRDHPGVLSKEEEKQMWKALGVHGGVDRRAKKMSGYAEESGSDADV
ncbi:hypothetical protein MMC24_000491 [Lignoscripta atroalba]|nr:hypothetical protein [Lignoscripta atroalba]